MPQGGDLDDVEVIGDRPARVSLVAAVGTNSVIGKDGRLPWPPTGDLAHFKALTMGHVLVMGRATYESIGRPLPGRTSIVLTRRYDWSAPQDVIVSHDVTGALDLAAGIDDEVFVIGGAQVYAATIEHAHRLVLTRVAQAPEGDVWFPEVDLDRWEEVDRSDHDGYSILTYDLAGRLDPPAALR